MKLLPNAFSRSLSVKFSLLILSLLFLVFSISSSILILQNIEAQKKTLVSQARAFANLSSKPIGNTYSLYYDSGYLKFQEIIKETLSLNSNIEKVQIISVNGEILFDSKNLNQDRPLTNEIITDKVILEKVNASLSSELPTRSSTSQPQEIIEPYLEDFGSHPFSIRYFVSYDSIAENFISTILTTVFLSFVFLAISIILIIFTVKRTILNPIELVVEGTRKISRGDLTHSIEVETKDEVEDLAQAVNQMSQTLKKNIQDLQELDDLKDEFVFLASHNLRTPITVIKGYLEIIQENPKLDSETLDKVEKISQATKNLEEITETLLSLVSFEKEREAITKKPVDLAAIVEEIGSQLGPSAVAKKISFIYELPNEPLEKIEMDESRIKQALTEIVDNAIKFNKVDGKVVIKIEKKTDNIVVSIKDTGIGISPEQKDKVFKKFHRTTDVLTYNYAGIGIGLYLTKLIIEAHQGKIWFDSAVGEGSTFYVSLPIKKHL